MSQIGCIGDVVLTVSSNTVKTIDNMQISGTARYATHRLVGRKAITEFTGVDPDKYTLDIVLSAYLGVSPMTEYDKLRKYMDTGASVPFVLGNRCFGYLWNVLSLRAKPSVYDKLGNILSITVSVTLQEYPRK